MFTGLVEGIGTVGWIRRTEKGTQLQISAPFLSGDVRRGESLAVNGCCLTVATHRGETLTFDLLEETLERTNLRHLRPGTVVNLERALALGARLGGHFVQGHIDCATRVLALEKSGDDHRLEVELPEEFSHYVAHKGSVAINGISFTVAEMLPASFAVFVIPQTRKTTTLETMKSGDWVNLEFDILAKYVERIVARDPSPA